MLLKNNDLFLWKINYLKKKKKKKEIWSLLKIAVFYYKKYIQSAVYYFSSYRDRRWEL